MLVGSLTADGTFTLKSGTTALSGPMDITGKAPIGLRGPEELPLAKTATGEKLCFTTTGGGFNGFAVVYVEGEG